LFPANDSRFADFADAAIRARSPSTRVRQRDDRRELRPRLLARCQEIRALAVAALVKVNTVPPASRGSHEIRASIKPARARMFASPRPSEFVCCDLNGRPLSSIFKEKVPSFVIVTYILTSVASA